MESSSYSPDVAQMESPKEGGFGQREPSVVMMKEHIKQLYGQLAKADVDKQKIADEAYRLSAMNWC